MSAQQNKTNTNTKRTAQNLAQAMDAEIRLLRYWMLQTLQNYKSWRASINNDGELPAKKIANMQDKVQGLINQSLREYRRKQSLLQNLIKKQAYFNDREIQYYRIENHFGAATAAAFANDNSAN